MTGKKWLIPALWASFAFVLLGLLVLGGYAVLNSMFPMASPVDYPDAESITSFSLIPKSDALVTVGPPDYAKYLQEISSAQPTRQMSMNDFPSVKDYYTIEIETPARNYRYFLYLEGSQVYLEGPYESIYIASRQLYDLVAEHFKN